MAASGKLRVLVGRRCLRDCTNRPWAEERRGAGAGDSDGVHVTRLDKLVFNLPGRSRIGGRPHR